MKRLISTGACIILFSAAAIGAWPQKDIPIDAGMDWQSVIPGRLTLAAQAHPHSERYEAKTFRYQKTGKVTDFFQEMGRPDKFSQHDFSLLHKDLISPSAYPLGGAYKYVYRDGTCVYMTSRKMDWVNLALLYKNGKLSRLLYK